MLAARWRRADCPTHPWRIPLAAVTTALLDAVVRSCGLSRMPHGPIVYLNVSHQQLDRPNVIRAILRWANARFVVMVHDLIPLNYPEYGRPGQAARHRRRIETVRRLADGILANSAATRDLLRDALVGCTTPVRVVPLGVEPAPSSQMFPAPATSDQAEATNPPYFVCLGTIEPRKNHLTLLHAWRQMAQAGGNLPHLYIVGRRGWENEMVIDLLERCAPIRPYLHECNDLPDQAVRALLRGARALLMPSFAEGYGLPLAEALSEFTPVICSDLPAHREIGGDVPDYLDPLNGLAWIEAIQDYAHPESSRRAAQRTRHADWQPPRWQPHMQSALDFLDRIGRVPVAVELGEAIAAPT
jgi:glycosyltransferase involved in cell wall biosynthesis